MQVLSFIRQCLNENDPLKLFSACSEAERSGVFVNGLIFQDLCEIERAETLERAFLEERQITMFPDEAETFKLGGHDLRRRCIHIDLERYEGHWRLTKLWKCR